MSKNKKLKYFIFLAIYSLLLYLINTRIGIITNNEAEKYILASKELGNGHWDYTVKHHLFYSSYVLFITGFNRLGGLHTVVIMQACLSFFAAVCLNKTIQITVRKNWAAYVGMFIFLASYPIQIWVLTLFSDSFFVSLITISLYYTIKQKSKSELIFWALLLVLLVFARPPGIFLSTLFFLYYLHQQKHFSKSQLTRIAFTFFSFIYIALFLIPAETKGFIKPIAAGAIIVDQPDYSIDYYNSIEKSNILSAYQYLAREHGTLYIGKLYLKKLHSFFTLTRPYYSRLHNTILIIHYPLYLLSIIGLFLLKNKSQQYLLLSGILLLANLTGLTYNEWHYRFTITIFPFLIILSSISISHFFGLLKKKCTVN